MALASLARTSAPSPILRDSGAGLRPLLRPEPLRLAAAARLRAAGRGGNLGVRRPDRLGLGPCPDALALMDWYAGSGSGVQLAVIGWHTGALGKLVFFIGFAIVALVVLRAYGFDLPALRRGSSCSASARSRPCSCCCA